MQLKVVLTHSNERTIYRILVEDEAPINNYDYLRALLIQTFPVLQSKDFHMTWRDSDADQVTIASSADLRMFLLAYIASETKVIYIETRVPTIAMTPICVPLTYGAFASTAAPQTLPTLPTIHRHVHCDSCNGPVTGNRYKCAECPDFDLCADCEAAGQHSDHLMMRTTDAEMFSSWVGRQLTENIAHLVRMIRGTAQGHREHKEAKRCLKQLKKHHGAHGHHGGKRKSFNCAAGVSGEGLEQTPPTNGVGLPRCPGFDPNHFTHLIDMVPGVLSTLSNHAASFAASAASAATAAAMAPDTKTASTAAPAAADPQAQAEFQTETQPNPTPTTTPIGTLQQQEATPFNFHEMLQNLMSHVAQPAQAYTPTNNEQPTAVPTTTAPQEDAAVAEPPSSAVSIKSVHSSHSSTAAAVAVAPSVGMEVDPKDKEEELQQQDWTLLRAEDDVQVPLVYPTLPSAPAPAPTPAVSNASPVLRLLHEMGFNHDDNYLNLLLQRYENNISQVVKHLVDNGSTR